ncbi:Bug family tripartite tricarboxylate transporter substrate binding protein [Ideonella paludis]|uniref:Tripartite tricarboxylate transporter substrate binding protein n=1 Tax=Ideonella paludis TaxID=1233411 RepID=A0ABS5DTH5_9BURK|nr:tripartite tricarboxylate transporter substrate binding protein [Ideonella paludis]MBQ0934437.1 tripartite tricarboxylate transporter substrate binding protein [Ideonella paludis]
MHRRLLLGTAVCAALSPWPAAAQGVAWPTKTVRVVVPAPAGSSLDIIARLLADKLKDRWGQPVVVENKAGAGGMLGVDVAAKATDGHTLAVGFNGPVAYAPFLYKKVPYDPVKDLVPVVMTTSQPNVLAVSTDKVPAQDVKAFIAWAKAQPQGWSYSSLGVGSSAHLTMELFLAEAGLTATHVPFNGSPPSAMAVAQGETQATFMVAPAMLAHVRNGKVRLLAVSSSQHPESLRELPTMAAMGFPKVESLAWNGLLMPAGTPEAVVQKVNADVNLALQDPAVRATMNAQGLSPVGGSPADFKRVIDAERERWAPVIKRLGLALD